MSIWPNGIPGTTRLKLSYVKHRFVFDLQPIKSAFEGPGAAPFNCPFLERAIAPLQDLYAADPITAVENLSAAVPVAKLLALKPSSGEDEVKGIFTYPKNHVYCEDKQPPFGGTCGSDVDIGWGMSIQRLKSA